MWYKAINKSILKMKGIEQLVTYVAVPFIFGYYVLVTFTRRKSSNEIVYNFCKLPSPLVFVNA